jgi:hypothetical protein
VKQSRFFAPRETRLLLGALAFILPFVLQVFRVSDYLAVGLLAPVYQYRSIDTPALRILPFPVIFLGLPFGMVRLLFVQQVYLYMKHRTSLRRLALIGVITEIPATVVGYLFSTAFPTPPFYSPVPILVALGLFFALKRPEREPMWPEEMEPESQDSWTSVDETADDDS